MPLIYIILHVAASGLCLFAAARAPRRPAWTASLALAAMAAVGLGLLIERRSDWAWQAMRISMTDLVFLTNLTLEGAAVLAALMLRSALTTRDRVRACALCAPLVSAALWSYAWYFEPAPADLTGKVDATGLCRQSSNETCSAAAAATLLHCYGEEVSELEMAGLCLTRAGSGTTPLGLYRGLAVAAARRGLHPGLVHIESADRLRFARLPAIVGVGLMRGIPREAAARMQGYGWSFTVRHTVVIMGADPDGRWLDVADPTNGRERWPTEDMRYLWDGSALTLARR